MRRRHRRRRLHRPVGGGASGQGGHQCRADRSASLRRRRIGPQWRPARHRPARLGRGMEAEYGFSRAKALFDLAEEAKAHLLEFAAVNQIEIDYMPGQMSVAHKKRYVDDYKAHAEIMASRFDYPHISFMDAAETAERLGSTALFRRHARHRHRPYPSAEAGDRHGAGGGGGRRAAVRADAGRPASPPVGGKVRVTTPRGTITAAEMPDRASTPMAATLEPVSAAHIMPIGSFIGATVPLGADSHGAAGRRGGRRFALRRALFPQIEGRPAAVRRPRDLWRQRSEGHPHPYPPADRGALSRAEGRRDHPWLGRLCRHHRAAENRSCAR